MSQASFARMKTLRESEELADNSPPERLPPPRAQPRPSGKVEVKDSRLEKKRMTSEQVMEQHLHELFDDAIPSEDSEKGWARNVKKRKKKSGKRVSATHGEAGTGEFLCFLMVSCCVLTSQLSIFVCLWRGVL